MPSPSGRSLIGSLGRQALGALSLAAGLALVGECAAHTARAVLLGEAKPDLVLRCFKAALFTPFAHAESYPILLAAGLALSLAGIALMRIWAFAFFAAAAACFAAFGGMVAERVVVPKGAEALLLQHGCSGLWTLFTEAPEGMGRDPLMILWIGFAALIPGLYLTHLHRAAKPSGSARGPVPRRPSGRAEADAFPGTPDDPVETGADTVADLDLSPDLETSEVHAPAAEGPEDLPSPEETPVPTEEPAGPETPAAGTDPAEPAADPPPVEEAPEPPAPERGEPEEAEAPENGPEPPAPGKALPAAALLLGLLSVAPAVLLFLSSPVIPDAWTARALGGGVGLGLGALALLALSGRMGILGWATAGVTAAGLAAAGTLLAMGGGT